MVENHPHSVSALERASGCSERWQMDLNAIRSLFRHHRSEAQGAEVQNPGTDALSCPIQEIETMSMAATTNLEIVPPRPLSMRLAVAAGCAALADWLFYGWPIGLSLALFFAVLGITAVACNGIHATRKAQVVMTTLFVAGLLALVEEVNLLSVMWSGLATMLFVIVLSAREASSWRRDLVDAATAPLLGPYQLATDLSAEFGRLKRNLPAWLRIDSLLAWFTPLVAFALFLALFASANPLIEYRLMQIDLRTLPEVLAPQRVAFWLLIICAIWPLIPWRTRKPRPAEFQTNIVPGPSEMEYLFGVPAVLRSLILLNMLFALQTVLALTYLWGGASLPDGLSHAEYAHRGAYPLIVTALLAAGFVLVAMRPSGPAEKSRLIRPLVLLWTGQNILLVISSIFRLDLYVAAYSLTYLRLAALIWMVLVAAGLLLMLAQMLLKKPNSWLVAANAATLALVLYGCCFINAPWLVASYNVRHCREVGGSGPNLDLQYLGSLGPQAWPALDAHRKDVPALLMAMDLRFPHARDSIAQPATWRAWSFRAWRLRRYLANNPDLPSPPSNAGKG
jgi:hypothetical protein